ncbi:MAG TPA: DMT family transporter [Candidatus Binatia bacterium]|nr:DMT family transporter [Candidatus Binatia bacterium]
MTFGPGECFSIACALAWAVSVILFKRSGESLAPLPLNLFKNAVGLALMAVTALIFTGPPPLPPDAVLVALLSGFLGIGVGDTLYFRGLNALGASRMGIAQTAYSPSVIVLSCVFLGERLSALQLAGVALVIGGILLVQDARAAHADARALRRGLLHAVASVFAMALGVVLAKPLLERHDFLWTVTLRLVGGAGGLLLFTAASGRLAQVRAAFGGVRHWPQVIAGSVLGSYVSMMLWLAGYKYTRASIAAVLNETTVLFILALAVLFLGERVGRRQLAGSAVAVAGVVLVVLR